jgi:hypothetical protein
LITFSWVRKVITIYSNGLIVQIWVLWVDRKGIQIIKKDHNCVKMNAESDWVGLTNPVIRKVLLFTTKHRQSWYLFFIKSYWKQVTNWRIVTNYWTKLEKILVHIWSKSWARNGLILNYSLKLIENKRLFSYKFVKKCLFLLFMEWSEGFMREMNVNLIEDAKEVGPHSSLYMKTWFTKEFKR